MSPSPSIAEAVASSTISAHLPNERVHGSVVGQRQVSIWFAPGHYQQVDEATLARELGDLARLLMVAGLRENRRITAEISGQVLRDRPVIGRQNSALLRFLEELTVEATSDDGVVSVVGVGQRSFTVTIAPGALVTTSEEAFAQSCGQAATRLVEQTEIEAARARWEIFGPLPGVSLEELDDQAVRAAARRS